LYEIEVGGRCEAQSSSCVIVSTGLGSTAWTKRVVAGAATIVLRLQPGQPVAYKAQAWDAEQLTFAVREPFQSKASQADLILGPVTRAQPLKLRSKMPDNGVIFSDGLEMDVLRFTAGVEATVTVAQAKGMLVV
jgi:hypothetical protein